jgi:hypothetical protein
MRMILSLVLLVCLLAPGVRAQATADQLNKLSLEALTAPPPRGSGGASTPSARHRPAWLPHRAASHAIWRRPSARSAGPHRRWSASRYHAPVSRHAAARRAPHAVHQTRRYAPKSNRR